jgi:hypothetical protein
MIEWLTEYLRRIADSVINPIVLWVLHLRWWARTLILIFILAIAGLVIYRDQIPKWATTGNRLYRVWGTDSKTFPFHDSEKKALENAIEDLSLHLDGEFRKRNGEDPIYGSWTIAQVAVALPDKNQQVTMDNMSTFMHEQMSTDNCWKQFRRKDCHIANTAWVLISFARVTQRVPDEQLRFVLSNQKADGWWSIFPTDNNPENASTYATAMSILALYEHLHKGLIGPERKQEVQRAINKGRAWLTATEVPNKARWLMYPLSIDKKESVSLSGLVIHVLYHLEPLPNPSLARLWLRTLPTTVPQTTDYGLRVIRLGLIRKIGKQTK